jgi:flagellar basal-body rod modification protein FlgD
MSAVESIQGLMNQYGIDPNKPVEQDELNKDAFLNLLVTQMQYQDPLEPTKNEDFLAQMAQFSALEQMNNLNASFQMQQGSEMVGKRVLGLSVNDVSKESTFVEGIVEAVTIKNGNTYLTVDGKDVLLSNVEAILNDTAATSEIVEAIEDINEALSAIHDKLDALTANQEEA